MFYQHKSLKHDTRTSNKVLNISKHFKTFVYFQDHTKHIYEHQRLKTFEDTTRNMPNLILTGKILNNAVSWYVLLEVLDSGKGP